MKPKKKKPKLSQRERRPSDCPKETGTKIQTWSGNRGFIDPPGVQRSNRYATRIFFNESLLLTVHNAKCPSSI